jgi:predicted DNA-binding transcriptional regulator AlpA
MVDLKQRLLGIAAVETLVGRERSTLRRWYVAGTFPRPRYIGTRRMWIAEEVEHWIAEATRFTAEVKP